MFAWLPFVKKDQMIFDLCAHRDVKKKDPHERSLKRDGRRHIGEADNKLTLGARQHLKSLGERQDRGLASNGGYWKVGGK